MLTVEDVWKLGLPTGTKLIGGAEGIHRQVSWVARMLPRAPGFKTLKGNEIALVSIQTMKQLDDRVSLVELLRRLTARNVAALAVLGEVSDDVLVLADSFNMPLFALPENTDLQETEQEIIKLTVERRTALYQNSQQIFMQLTELALDGQGITTIARRLSDILDKPIATANEELKGELFVSPRQHSKNETECRAAFDLCRDQILHWGTTINLNQPDPPCERFDQPEANLALLVVPVISKGYLWGFIILFTRPQDVSEDQRLALTRTAAACAIGIARDRAVLEAQDRIHSSFVDDLLANNFSDTQTMQERGKRLGYTLSPSYSVLVFEATDARGSSNSLPSAAATTDLDARLVAVVSKLWQGQLYKTEGSTLVLLLPIETELTSPELKVTKLKNTAEAFRATLATALENTSFFAIGIGRVYAGLRGIQTSYHEAKQAVDLGSHVFGASCLTYFGDLGVYRLLFNLQGTDDLNAFYNETLGSLMEYDQKTNSDLINTLRAYFTNCTNIARAAEELQLHRNSLLYRLQRVKEISGLDLDNSEARFALQLALHIGEIIESSAPQK